MVLLSKIGYNIIKQMSTMMFLAYSSVNTYVSAIYLYIRVLSPPGTVFVFLTACKFDAYNID